MTSKNSKGVARGLGSILGEMSDVDQMRKPIGYINKEIAGAANPGKPTADIIRIPIRMIEPNPFQPRVTFNPEALDELAESIRTLGLIQPVTVRRISSDKYQIISGERRFRACKIAGLDMIPAFIREANDQGMLEMAIVENVQRENLDPIEVAMSYQRLMDECSLTQEEMAKRIGKKRTSVTNYLRLLKLPLKAQHDLKVGLISVGHAKAILGVDDTAVQEQLCDLVVRNSISVRQLEDKIRKCISDREREYSDKSDEDLPEEYYKVLEFLGRFFGDKISLKRNKAGKGSITLRFTSDDEMRNLLKAIESTVLK